MVKGRPPRRYVLPMTTEQAVLEMGDYDSDAMVITSQIGPASDCHTRAVNCLQKNDTGETGQCSKQGAQLYAMTGDGCKFCIASAEQGTEYACTHCDADCKHPLDMNACSPYGTLNMDECGVCAGDGSTCRKLGRGETCLRETDCQRGLKCNGEYFHGTKTQSGTRKVCTFKEGTVDPGQPCLVNAECATEETVNGKWERYSVDGACMERSSGGKRVCRLNKWDTRCPWWSEDQHRVCMSGRCSNKMCGETLEKPKCIPWQFQQGSAYDDYAGQQGSRCIT